jgi:hypothetical protein
MKKKKKKKRVKRKELFAVLQEILIRRNKRMEKKQR